MKRIHVLAGEHSGDLHGAGLISALRERDPALLFAGAGGPRMRAAANGADDGLEDWVDQAGVTGLWEVLKRYGWFKRQFETQRQRIREWQPDTVVLVDYPGFNLRLAKVLRRDHPDMRLVYFIAPQVWAWKKGRIKTMARDLDLMICIFPFERPLFENAGLRTVFCGHPLVDTLWHKPGTAGDQPVGHGRDLRLVAFFPGSRRNEVERLGPVLVATARRMAVADPGRVFAFSAASDSLAARLREWLMASAIPKDRWQVVVGREQAHRLMREAAVGAVASGTATLEAACLGLPHVLVYRVNWFTYLMARLVVDIRHLGIVNVIADETVVAELIQGRCNPAAIEQALGGLLLDPVAADDWGRRIDRVLLGLSGDPDRPAYATAAAAVLAQSR